MESSCISLPKTSPYEAILVNQLGVSNAPKNGPVSSLITISFVFTLPEHLAATLEGHAVNR